MKLISVIRETNGKVMQCQIRRTCQKTRTKQGTIETAVQLLCTMEKWYVITLTTRNAIEKIALGFTCVACVSLQIIAAFNVQAINNILKLQAKIARQFLNRTDNTMS